MTIREALQTGIKHHVAGHLREAEAVYRQILAQQPNHPDALHLLGVVASQAGNQAAAVELIGAAIKNNPRAADYHSNLGLALAGLGRLPEAVASHRRAVALQPNTASFLNNLGNSLESMGETEEATECFRKAITLKGDYADPHYNLGNLHRNANRFEEAVQRYRHALALRPNWSMAQSDLGLCLSALGRYDEALAMHRQALSNQPDDPMAHWNLALVLLRMGDLGAGLPEYEWRWKVRELNLTREHVQGPQWNGEELAGRRILLYCEQGFGDTIQFVRYVPMVAARGGRVTVVCQNDLRPLLERMAIADRWISVYPPPGEYDLHCPLASLPSVMMTTATNIPANIPYLTADAALNQKWKQRLQSLGGGPKVGLSWAGKPSNLNDRNRSVELRQLTALAEAKNVTFISLQKGEAAAQPIPAGMKLVNWTSDLTDFNETAGLIANLDLVVSVDTAVVHLAGTMGKPAWVLIPFVPDWRWMINRTDSPWYPTLRLFRQDKAGDWKPPIAHLARQLAEFGK